MEHTAYSFPVFKVINCNFISMRSKKKKGVFFPTLLSFPFSSLSKEAQEDVKDPILKGNLVPN